MTDSEPLRPWSRRAFIGGLVAAVLMAVALLLITRSVVALLLLGFIFAWGCSSAAFALLVAWLVRRLRGGRQLPPWLSPVDAALIALVGGVTLAGGGAAILVRAKGLGNGQQLIVVGLGAVLATWGGLRLRGGREAASSRARGVLALLAATVLAVWVPREVGLFSLRISQQHWRVTSNSSHNVTCSGGRRRRGRYRWVLVSGGSLRGDLGELLDERIGHPARRPGVVRVHIAGGRLDVAGPSCYLPLYRTASGRGDVSFWFTFRAGAAQCTAHHRLTLHLDASSVGVAACRDLLRALASGVIQEIHKSIRQTL